MGCGTGGFGGGGHIGGAGRAHGYSSTWMADTKKTLEDELRSRGIEPQTPLEDGRIVVPEDKCYCVAHVAIALLIATILFAVFWELT
jgi:hypothetical protein